MNSIDSYLRARDYTSSSINASNFSTPEGNGDGGKVYTNGYENNNNNSSYNGGSAYASSPVAVKTTVVPKSNGDYSSPTFQNDEDWVTKKRVETVTTKSQEKRLQKQVVLEDGRVISEAVPEVTTDTVEDRQSHEEDASEDRTIGFDGSFLPTASAKGLDGTILGEKFQRNINTRDVQSSSMTTAAAQNLGEITDTNVQKVINHGRDVRSLVRSYEGDGKNGSHSRALAPIPAKVLHRDSNRRRTVDKEDVREVSRMHQGKIKTDRFVSREVIEDKADDTPDSGSSTESESHAGDAHGYTQHKEDRFVDYYQVPRGRPTGEGKLIRKGIHLSSHDKQSRKVDPSWTARARHRALAYDDQSDSTDGRPRPPRPERNRSKHGGGHGSGNSNSSFPITRAAPPPTLNRGYHTIERSQKVGSKSDNKYHRRSYTPINGGGHGRHSDSDRSYRSRSMSRSSGRELSERRNSSHHENNNPTGMRDDLDQDRASRLRRAMSFTSSTKSFGLGGGKKKTTSVVNGHETQQPERESSVDPQSSSRSRDSRSQSKTSFLGSVKSLYASIRRGSQGGKKKSHGTSADGRARSTTPSEWFDRPDSRARPAAPPRKHRSTSNLGGSSLYSDNSHSGSKTTRNWSSFTGNNTNNSSNMKRSRPSSSYHPRASQENLSPNAHPTYADPRMRRTSDANGGRSSRSMERRKTISSYDDMADNRDAPRFEPRNRSNSRSRFFGEEELDIGSSGADDSSVVRRESRPAPDMRKYLLNSVNVSRRQSMTRDPETRPQVGIRA